MEGAAADETTGPLLGEGSRPVCAGAGGAAACVGVEAAVGGALPRAFHHVYTRRGHLNNN